MPSQREIQQQLAVFGANVRRERMARDITQEKLSELIDLNIRTLQRVEAGETNILMTTTLRLRRAIGCGWDDLMRGLNR